MNRVKNTLAAIIAVAITFTFNACSDNPFNDDGGSSSSGGGISSSGGGSSSSSSDGGNSSSSGGGGNGTTQEQAISLTDGKWAEGKITATSGEVWYKFDVVTGTDYYIWWSDPFSGPMTYGLDVKVTAYFSNADYTNYILFEEKDDVSTEDPQLIMAQSSGTIHFKVVATSEENIGSFGIVYSTSTTMPNGYGNVLGICGIYIECLEYINMNDVWNVNSARQNCNTRGGTWTANSTCPVGWIYYSRDEALNYYVYPQTVQIPSTSITLTSGNFVEGQITVENGYVWYSFDVTRGNDYYVYLEDSDNNDDDYTADTFFAAYYNNNGKGIEIFNADNAGGYPMQLFTAEYSGKVYVKVYVGYSTGTFGIEYGIDEPW
jgi:hypothetical protein